MRRAILLTGALAMVLSSSATTLSCLPGNVKYNLAQESLADKSLTLTGSIDVRDLLAVAERGHEIEILDLSDVKIEHYNSRTPLIYGNSVFAADELPAYVFQGAKIPCVILPADLKAICQGAFLGSAIKSVEIPAGTERIEDFAFRDCRSLETVAPLPSSVKTLGREAFCNASVLGNIDLSATSISHLQDGTFRGTTVLETISLPNTLTQVGETVFYESGLYALTISMPVQAAPFSFSGMSRLTTSAVTVTNPTETPGIYYSNPKHRSVTPLGAEVPEAAFAYNAVLNPETALSGARVVGDYALASGNCATITLNPGLERLGNSVFAYPYELKVIDVRPLEDKVVEVTEETFQGLEPEGIILQSTPEHYQVWEAHPQWGRFDVKHDTSSVAETLTLDTMVSYADGAVRIHCSEPLNQVIVYSTEGHTLAMSNQQSTDIVLPVSASGPVIMVWLRSGNHEKSVKLLIP